MNLLTTLKQALEALEYGSLDRYPNSVADIRCKEACADLRAAIEQIEKREPLGFVETLADEHVIKIMNLDRNMPLYAFPPEFAAPKKPLGVTEGTATSSGAAPDLIYAGICQCVPYANQACPHYKGQPLCKQPDAETHTLIERQQAEIERLTKERDAYCEKWHKELALGDELRQQLSAAVTHGAELMRGREGGAGMNIGQMTEALGSPPLKTEAQLLREEIERRGLGG